MTSEICIPLGSLAEGGEDEKSSVPPAVGDPVEFKASGTVSRVEGDQAYITLETVNDEPVPEAEPEPGPMDEAALMTAAGAADEEQY